MTLDQQELLQSYLGEINAHAGRLNDREREFIKNTADRSARYGERMFFSAKQWTWLRQIYERVTDL